LSVLAHEHLALNFFNPRVRPDDSFAWTVASLRRAVAHGVTEVWDLTNQSFGRDFARLAAVSDAAGVAIVASTGYYLDRFHPEDARSLSAEEVARAWIRELNDGRTPSRYA
jgi:phosphotriesterase-related protein